MKKDSFGGRLESTKNQITRTKEPEMECSTESTTAHEIKTSCVQSLYEILRQVPDHRDDRGKRYEAALVLVLLLLAKLGGEQTMSGIAEWARLRQEWLAGLLPLKTLPCANTYTYVLIHIDMSELNEAVRQWSHWNGKRRRSSTGRLTVRYFGEVVRSCPQKGMDRKCSMSMPSIQVLCSTRLRLRTRDMRRRPPRPM
ncbi:hypothetical protein GC175_01820 [bacterium]|nr:hypothetical protein [bacterium]